MAKSHRGTGIRSLPHHGRGTCPVCKTEGIKVLYEHEINGEKVKTCKHCNGHLKNEARKAAKLAKASAATESSAEATEAAETAEA